MIFFLLKQNCVPYTENLTYGSGSTECNKELALAIMLKSLTMFRNYCQLSGLLLFCWHPFCFPGWVFETSSGKKKRTDSLTVTIKFNCKKVTMIPEFSTDFLSINLLILSWTASCFLLLKFQSNFDILKK